MYFLYYTTVIWSVLACSQATPKFGNEANLSWFLLCRVTVMACSDVSGSPVDEQTFIQVCMQWHWQLVTVASTAGHILANSPTMSTPQLKVGSWPSGNWGIDRNTAGQWSVLLGLAWAGSVCVTMAMSRECVCYHDNKVYLSGLTPAVEEVHDIPWGLGLTPVVEEVHGIPWGLQLTRHCLIAYTCIPINWVMSYIAPKPSSTGVSIMRLEN